MRTLETIAREVVKTWGKNISYSAKPYLDAMLTLGSIHDNFYNDSGKSVVRYFLANATGWRGDDARRIKAELNTMLKS